MYQIFIILMKINFVLLLFTGAYYLILKNFTFYNLNRAYLMFAIIFSSIYPFINLTKFFIQHEEKLASVGEMVKSLNTDPIIKQQSLFDFWGVIITVISIGIFALMFRLMVQLYSLFQIHKNTKPDNFKNFKIRRLNDKIGPFSFWKTIYINPSIYNDNELKTILEHEKVHVDQLHTLDILIAELSTVFHWFNPGIWLMKKAIKENIEYITDQKILSSGIDRKVYQYNLLTVSNLKLQTSVVNSFNFSDIKKRIKMMNATKSAKSKLLIYMVILPLLLTTCLAFTVSVLRKESTQKFIVPQPPKGLFPIAIKVSGEKEPKKSTTTKALTDKNTRITKFAKAEDKPLISNKILSISLEEKLQPEDTIIFSPEILKAKLNKITGKLENSMLDYKGVKFDNIKIGITPNSASANYKIKKVAIIRLDNNLGFNPKDSSKVIYYLNGKVIDNKDLNFLPTEKIKSINIIKNKITGTGIIIESN